MRVDHNKINIFFCWKIRKFPKINIFFGWKIWKFDKISIFFFWKDRKFDKILVASKRKPKIKFLHFIDQSSKHHFTSRKIRSKEKIISFSYSWRLPTLSRMTTISWIATGHAKWPKRFHNGNDFAELIFRLRETIKKKPRDELPRGTLLL
jgi:hypothetical protein